MVIPAVRIRGSIVLVEIIAPSCKVVGTDVGMGPLQSIIHHGDGHTISIDSALPRGEHINVHTSGVLEMPLVAEEGISGF